MAGKAEEGSACDPPRGSGTISSMMPNLTSSGAVMRSASVAYWVENWMDGTGDKACRGRHGEIRPRWAC